MLDVPKSFHHTNVSIANDIHSRSVVAIVCNKKQCRILYLNIHTKNLFTYYKKILPNKFNTATHTVKETIKSNTNQLHKRNTIRKNILQYNHIQKQKTMCKDTVQYDHIRQKNNDDSNFPILPLVCKNIQTSTTFQNNIAISPDKKIDTQFKKIHNNIAVSENQSTIQVPHPLHLHNMISIIT